MHAPKMVQYILQWQVAIKMSRTFTDAERVTKDLLMAHKEQAK